MKRLLRCLLAALAAAVAPAWGDISPPPFALTDFGVATPQVDLGKAPGVARFRIGIANAGEGLNQVYLMARSPHGQQVYRSATPATGQRDGSFLFDTPPLSRYAEDGVWTVEDLILCNRPPPGKTGECLYFHAADLATLGFATTFRVLNPGWSDSTPPRILGAHIVTEKVVIRDGRATPDRVRMRVLAGDDLSGIRQVGVCLIDAGSHTICGLGEPLAARTADGPAFAEQYVLPWLTPGDWQFDGVFALDVAGNYIYLDSPEKWLPVIDGNTTVHVIEVR